MCRILLFLAYNEKTTFLANKTYTESNDSIRNVIVSNVSFKQNNLRDFFLVFMELIRLPFSVTNSIHISYTAFIDLLCPNSK